MTPDIPSSYFHFIPGVEKFTNDASLLASVEVLIILDTWAKHMSMLHDADEATLPEHILVIDHHLSRTGYGWIELVDPASSSVCGLLTWLLQATYPERIEPDIATYLFMWISTDTGHFMREEDPVRTFWYASYLLEKWANKPLLVKHLFRNNALDAMKFVWVLLQRITKTGHVLRTWFQYSELVERWIDEAKIEVVVMLLASINHDGVFVLFKAHDTVDVPYIKCSLRCQHEDMNVAKLAEQFWWWGHRASAWARINSTPWETFDIHSIIPSLLQQMNTTINIHLTMT